MKRDGLVVWSTTKQTFPSPDPTKNSSRFNVNKDVTPIKTLPCSGVISKIAYDIVEKGLNGFLHETKKKLESHFQMSNFNINFAFLGFEKVPPVNLAALTPFLAAAFLTAMATTEAVFDPSSARKST